MYDISRDTESIEKIQSCSFMFSTHLKTQLLDKDRPGSIRKCPSFSLNHAGLTTSSMLCLSSRRRSMTSGTTRRPWGLCRRPTSVCPRVRSAALGSRRLDWPSSSTGLPWSNAFARPAGLCHASMSLSLSLSLTIPLSQGFELPALYIVQYIRFPPHVLHHFGPPSPGCVMRTRERP